MIDLSPTDEQRELCDAVGAFARQHLNDDIVRRDAAQEFSHEAWRRCADLGIHGLPVPEAYGGVGADPVTTMLVLEALGAACSDGGLLFSLHAHMWSCELPIVRFGTERQRQRYLPGLSDGSLVGVQGMSEPDAGSDAFSVATTARRDGERYVLNGSKTFITNAPIADLFVVFAVTDAAKGPFGLSAFLVEAGSPGLEIGPTLDKMGLRTSPMSEVFLDGCAVPSDRLLASEGAGMAVFNTAMCWERSFILATAVGAMQRQLDRCIAYAGDRAQFGQSIGKFQSVADRVVDMKLRLETARLLLYRLAWLHSQGESTTLDASLAKLFVSEAFLQSSLDAVQIHGGAGYLTQTEIERDLRDAVAGRIYSGTSEIQRKIAARYLGL